MEDPMQRQRSRSSHPFSAACAVLCAVLPFLPQSGAAQEYYGVPIENGGVAFLLDVSGSMDNKGERIKAAAESILRDLTEAWRNRSLGQSGTGPSPRQRAGEAAAQISKLGTARKELLHALDSLSNGTSFTIITFGQR